MSESLHCAAHAGGGSVSILEIGRVWSALVSRRRVVHSAHELQSWPVAESKLMLKYGCYSLAVAIRVCVDAL